MNLLSQAAALSRNARTRTEGASRADLPGGPRPSHRADPYIYLPSHLASGPVLPHRHRAQLSAVDAGCLSAPAGSSEKPEAASRGLPSTRGAELGRAYRSRSDA
eukprot:351545-Chlamydomonas_euryale.AAC.3